MGWLQTTRGKIQAGAAALAAVVVGIIVWTPITDLYSAYLAAQGVTTDPQAKVARMSAFIEQAAASRTFILCAGLAVGFAIGIWLDVWLRRDQKRSPKSETVRQLFENLVDAPRSALAHIAGEVKIDLDDGASVVCQHVIIADFAAGSRHLAIYTPKSRYTFEVCRDLIRGARQIIESPTTLAVRVSGDGVTQESHNLTFTGRVYIFHETDLTREQVGQLEAFARETSLSVILRGEDSLLAELALQKQKPPKPKPPLSSVMGNPAKSNESLPAWQHFGMDASTVRQRAIAISPPERLSPPDTESEKQQ